MRQAHYRWPAILSTCTMVALLRPKQGQLQAEVQRYLSRIRHVEVR